MGKIWLKPWWFCSTTTSYRSGTRLHTRFSLHFRKISYFITTYNGTLKWVTWFTSFLAREQHKRKKYVDHASQHFVNSSYPTQNLNTTVFKFKILKILHNTENTVFSFKNTGGTFKFKWEPSTSSFLIRRVMNECKNQSRYQNTPNLHGDFNQRRGNIRF